MKPKNLCECGCGQPTNIAKKTSTRDGIVKGQSYRFLSGHSSRLPENKEHLKENMAKATEIRKKKLKKQYPVNNNVYENEDALSFYILGCYTSDGNVHIDGNVYNTQLHSNDKEWLEAIRLILFPKTKIRKSKKSEMYTLAKKDKPFGTWLVKYGCIPNKSLTVRLSRQIPNKYFRDFLRGLIDGDGTIYLGKHGEKKYRQAHVELSSGSKEFLQDIQKKLDKNNFKSSITTKEKKPSAYAVNGGRVHYLYLSSYGAYEFLNWLYYSKNLLCLERKKEKAEEIIAHYAQKRNPREYKRLKEKAIRLRKQNKSHSIIAEEMGISLTLAKNLTKDVKNIVATIRKKKETPPELRAKARKLANSGMPNREISEQLQIPLSTSYSITKDYHPVKKNIIKDKILRLRKEKGLSLQKIVSKTGYSKSKVKYYLAMAPELPVKNGSRNTVTEQHKKQIIKLKKQKMSFKAIAERLKLSESTVKKHYYKER